MALALLLSSWLLGGMLLAALPYRFHRVEFGAGAVVGGTLIGSWVTMVLSLSAPYTRSQPMAIVALGMAAGLLFGRSRCTFVPRREEVLRQRPWQSLTLVSVVGLGYLFWTHMALARSDGGLYSGGSAWSDLGLHTSLMTYQSQQARLDMTFPLVYQGRLAYHFLIDFLSSLFLRDGFSLSTALLVPSLPLALAFLQLAFFTSYRLSGGTGTGVLGVALFLLGGSTLGPFLCLRDMLHAPGGAWAMLGNLQIDYTTDWPDHTVFSNALTCALLPERPVLFGWGAVLLLMDVMLLHETSPSRRGPWAMGVLAGLLPLAQVHAWMVAMALLGAASLREGVTARNAHRRPAWPWCQALALCLAISLPTLHYLLGVTQHASFGTLKVGWLAGPDEPVVLFWLRQMGPALAFMGLIAARCRGVWRGTLVPWLGLAFLVVFAVANVAIMQPNDYDNIKLFHLVYLCLALLSAPILVEWVQGSTPARLLALGVMGLWMMPGLLSLWRELCVSNWQMASAEERAFALVIQTQTRPTACFMAPPDPHQPVSFLAGRRVVLGFPGWLASYGLDIHALEVAQQQVYAGDPQSAAILARYGVDYVVCDKARTDQWHCNGDCFRTWLPRDYEDARWVVFQVAPR